jgi:hypothetical protein
MFSDDIVVFGNSINGLVNKIKKIFEWAVNNRMKINCRKSGILEWNINTSIQVNRDWYSAQTEFDDIEEVTEYRYLGVLIKGAH